ncbi:hypothetical protein BaRGS_00020261 [Batillaria attramentaria]|uniref:Protein wntless n=1 Tax=Batillaria attramentaria TaxID=370345 RepID=A0ABD0KMZ4_9CAEN
MAGVVLETLSTRKLTVLVVSLFVCLVGFFLVGGLVAPAPTSTINSIPIHCVNKDHELGKKAPLIPRGEMVCHQVMSLDGKEVHSERIEANQIVFTDGVKPLMLLDASLWAKDADDVDWKELYSAKVERRLDCTIDEKKDGNTYSCDLLPLFDLGSVYYHYYLLNIRLPVSIKSEHNTQIGQLTEMQFITIFQNGGFTKVWFSLKTVLFPVTLTALVWFWRRIMQLSRPANLLERTLFSLGVILSIMNCPIEWITLWVDAPFMLLLNDIREGAFYAMLLCFWLIFAGEHMMDQVERNKLSAYWKHLLAVIVGCLALFIFEMCERGMQLANPFYSIWSTSTGTNAALAFIIMAGAAACVYFLFLSYMIFRVFRNISSKATSLSQMSNVRRKFYAGLIFRFKFLMVTTLLCAALTVIFFIISQISEGQWKWGDEGIFMEYSSAFLTGVYGMWNMYTIALLSLYAPSHKTTASAESLDGTREEEVQLTQIPSESTAFTSIISKSTID